MAAEPMKCNEKRRSGVCKLNDEEGTIVERLAERHGSEGITRPRTRSRHPQEQRVSSSQLATGVHHQHPTLHTRS